MHICIYIYIHMWQFLFCCINILSKRIHPRFFQYTIIYKLVLFCIFLNVSLNYVLFNLRADMLFDEQRRKSQYGPFQGNWSWVYKHRLFHIGSTTGRRTGFLYINNRMYPDYIFVFKEKIIIYIYMYIHMYRNIDSQ